ncbi:MAG: flavin reductase family protein [Anaerolineae bacterium]|jgi:flavin reductase (DIM6/NTAB) family NADH-FMN oxidoreductase RutF|nr:flavin reductase family protein [Chloroflexota bacterium]
MSTQRVAVPYDHQLGKTLALLRNPGLLLAATGASGRSNAMTIGWGSVGIIWGLPVFIALVRPSRFTYGLIEETGEFTVNVPAPEMRRFVGLCGTKSGRDIDKFAEGGISTQAGQQVRAVTIDGCPLVYECRSVHYNDLIPENLLESIEKSSYGGSDYHRLYFGQILGTYASPDY